MKKDLTRRQFVKNSVVGGAGLLGGGTLLRGTSDKKESIASSVDTPRVQKYRVLGRTGFKVSDVSMGFSNNEAIIKTLMDRGMNYIDTAESYGNQKTVGQAIRDRDRKSIFVTSKLEIRKKDPKTREHFLKRFRKCLDELGGGYIDCMMVHSPDTVEIMKTPAFHQVMEQMKREGKLRFVGVSHHGSNHAVVNSDSMEKVLGAAAEDGRFDVFLMAYNFLQVDNGKRVLKLCQQKGIGTTIMKKNPVGSYYGYKRYVERAQKEGKEINKLYIESVKRFKKKLEMAQGFIDKYGLEDQREIRDAAIRWVLNDPQVNSVVCSVRNFDQVDQYLALSGTNLSVYEKKKLAAYRQGCGSLYCRHACGQCETSCPQGVPVNTIMRYYHYYDGQGKEKYALRQYNRLEGARADTCLNCAGHCESACPYGVPVQGMLLAAHDQLTLA